MKLEDISKVVDDNTDKIYEGLESLCICFPARLSGSEILEKSLDFLFEYGKLYVPEEHCREERVEGVPQWIRGDWKEEYCTINIVPESSAWPMPFPLERTIQVLANGMSVGTPQGGVSADLVLVSNWDELSSLGKAGSLRGKLVLYDYKRFSDYGGVSAYRYNGWYKASEYGAVGVLVRSLTPDDSTSGAHTGTQRAPALEPSGQPVPIPGACIAVEDAEMLRRLVQRGHRISATLHLPCQVLPPVTSRNLSFEIRGSKLPDEVVLLGAHADCWDCIKRGCQGAHDDGQGVVIAIELLRILYEKNWRPKRTIRVVVYTDEEVMSTGGIEYAKLHEGEVRSIKVAIETDLGVGPVAGYGCTASGPMKDFLRSIILPPLRQLLSDGDLEIKDEWTGRGVDIGPLLDHQVPGLLLRHYDAWWTRDYFHYHHTNSDSIDKIDKGRLAQNAKALLLTAWVLANVDTYPDV
ncbi:M20/M25/M40 family metallo-hydrolase [archaeon]|nr:MAG: M20/M25/M40 family metallo-hydrolase [archaeon]